MVDGELPKLSAALMYQFSNATKHTFLRVGLVSTSVDAVCVVFFWTILFGVNWHSG